MLSREYLNDYNFLDTLIRQHNQTLFVKITVLDFLENPVQEIQGKVSGGNISLNGSSSIRRTCNLTFIADQYTVKITDVNNLLSINKKVKVEIGLINTTMQYLLEDTIWLPMGVYIIINPSISHSSSGIQVSLQLKDKMCLLNGECGGTISAATTFHEYETLGENGEYIIERPTIFQIILELVNHFGKEQLGKIIINDLTTKIKKVQKWTGSTPVYLYTIEKEGKVTYELSTDPNKHFEGAISTPVPFSYGKDIGYFYSDFYYPGDLIANAGDSVCTILDKIKNTLGNYEYFYDVEGNFIFQEIKNYLNTTQASVDLGNIDKNNYLINRKGEKSVYSFDDNSLLISSTKSPQYNMIKNDFIIWGARKNINNNTIPIRYHLAIDTKPKVGNKYKVFFYIDPNDELRKAKIPLIFENKDAFPKKGESELFYLDNETNLIYLWDSKDKKYVLLDNVEIKEIVTSDWRSELYLSGTIATRYATDSNDYYVELANEWPKIYNLDAKQEQDYFIGEFKPELIEQPENLDYYLDFIDSSTAISEFNVSNIGRRTKVINDNKINCMFEPEIPDFVLIEKGKVDTDELVSECINKGQKYIQIDSSIYKMLSGGGRFNSAFNLVKDLLYQYTNYNEAISLQTLPVYFLEPNTRITVRDPEADIYGDYMINSISMPLGINGTMSISCTKALERI